MVITEAQIRRLATAQSYEKGENYYTSQRVSDLQMRGDVLTAQVAGTDYEPYRVTVHLAGNRIGETACTCPYDYEGACKHIVAVLLAYMRQPEQIESRPPIKDLLDQFSDAELREVFSEILRARPELLEQVEAKLQMRGDAKAAKTSATSAKTPATRSAPINVAAF
jgi:uncharacterized Zn finger protein